MAREVRVIRPGVGLYDASPLGKVELTGPDALEFADPFYINSLAVLKPDARVTASCCARAARSSTTSPWRA